MSCLDQNCVLLLMQSSENLAGKHPVYNVSAKLAAAVGLCSSGALTQTSCCCGCNHNVEFLTVEADSLRPCKHNWRLYVAGWIGRQN